MYTCSGIKRSAVNYDSSKLTLFNSLYDGSITEHSSTSIVHCCNLNRVVCRQHQINSYVNFSLVGHLQTGSDSVQCHTDLTTCCSGGQGTHRGDWYFPNGTRLTLPGGTDIHESHEKKRVDLRRWSATSPTGMYHCDIATTNHNETTQKRVYVGLYVNGGGLY